MVFFVLRRMLGMIPILFLITIGVFLVMQVLPGDPARMILGQEATPEALAAVRERLGLNQPLHMQYLSWLGNVMTGDLGRSMVDNSPVSRAILNALPVTLQITALALLVGLVIGVPAGVIAATSPGRLGDGVATFIGLTCISLPGFWVAVLLLYVFSLWLGWLPSSGFVRFSVDPWQSFLHSIMPAIALGLRPAGIFMRLVRSSMIEVMKSDYVRTARAKGLTARAVILRHGLRTSLIPLVTILSVEFAALLGNVVVIDTIFGLPGFGRLIFNSVLRLDLTMMQSLVLIFAVAVIVINLVTDILYFILDPRIKER
ncbi:ABC transporter permease [Rhodobacteraceae bacterium 2376]|uniref:ABC transporter permease n=1 Tax=Rhabdonatronobacter sediminivivens TaxID=2743469 RepID=A0A7Z0HZX5_9RHOB|nr:ABC transporter permease subunit [Rhabdonatronobacter sediminivivens]NYS25377.1 ABC transporter permease [Rhabdonatronobacter sediminivivens]